MTPGNRSAGPLAQVHKTAQELKLAVFLNRLQVKSGLPTITRCSANALRISDGLPTRADHATHIYFPSFREPHHHFHTKRFLLPANLNRRSLRAISVERSRPELCVSSSQPTFSSNSDCRSAHRWCHSQVVHVPGKPSLPPSSRLQLFHES